MDYKPSGVCSRLIHVELDGDKIANVEFVGGCKKFSDIVLEIVQWFYLL